MRLCLDTSAYSHFKRAHAGAVEAISTATRIVVPSVVLGELHTGFRLGPKRVDAVRELEAFLSHPVVHVVSTDAETAALYAEFVAALRNQGTPLPTNDVWIAACAARDGAAVLTSDARFRFIERIGVHLLQ